MKKTLFLLLMGFMGMVGTYALAISSREDSGVAPALNAQEQHDEQKNQQEDEDKDKPVKAGEERAQPEGKKAQEAKPKQ